MMLTDKNHVLVSFLCRLHSFRLVGTGLYSASSSPGFPFGHISVASGSSSSYSHIIVAHLIISKKVLMYCTKKTTLHRLFLLASYVFKATGNIPVIEKDLYFQII